jgi:hypothetical protein
VSQPRLPEVMSSFVPGTIYRGDRDNRRDSVPPHYARTGFGPSTLASNRRSKQEALLSVAECGIGPLELSKCVVVSGVGLGQDAVHQRARPFPSGGW